MTLTAGFADPVHDAQSVFRCVMDAMARPGRIGRVAAPAEPPPPLARATAAVLLTLVDAETPLAMQADPATWEWVGFHCGAGPAAWEAASFAVAFGPADLAILPAGSDEEPERGATLILQVAELGAGKTLSLRGPGLESTATLAVTGLPPDFRAAWAANNRLFPRGVDVILCAGDSLAALPRTVRIV